LNLVNDRVLNIHACLKLPYKPATMLPEGQLIATSLLAWEDDAIGGSSMRI
jgi:hypothetical protein